MILVLIVVTAAGLAAAIGWFAGSRWQEDASASLQEDRERESAARSRTVETERGALLRILNGIGEGLLALDRNRRVVLANRRFVRMFGISDDIVGRPLSEVIRIAAVFDACDTALSGDESSERFPMPAGMDERRIEVRAIPLPSDPIGAVALFIDVTQLERLEDIRRNFISDFTHEVRTPLAGLATAVESYDFASRPMAPDDDLQLRKIMTRQLQRLQRLVDDLSELSGIEAGDLTLDIQDVDLGQLLEELCEEFADRAAQKKLLFKMEGTGVRVPADALRIQQAFSNLIDNAIKYGGEGSTIDIVIQRRDGWVVVRVTDHGEGIEPAERERIFRRFYRIDKSRSQDVTGTGLGLAITKHLVALHRGSIEVESEPGKGASFVVKLPVN